MAPLATPFQAYAGISDQLLRELDVLFPPVPVNPLDGDPKDQTIERIMFRAGQRNVVEVLRIKREQGLREVSR